MKLKDYRALLKLTIEQAAEQLGTVKENVWRWENGKHIPRAEHMANIQKWSKGAVMATDFYSEAAQ